MRGKKATRREIRPDSKFGNQTVAKLINYIMLDGKKSVARGIVYEALDTVSKRTEKDPLDVFDEAMKNITPTVETKSKRVGGANYQVPMPVRGERRMALAFRWLIEAARRKKGKSMGSRLASELMAAAQGEGDAVKKKMDVHRMAEANRAFAHFSR
ncbi:30S ribosomal protein S7 [Candidatus Uhrbacteria bacterium]|nr:30S ribosomal protein S7 [Candidatus Uhrbacteria bacterium]